MAWDEDGWKWKRAREGKWENLLPQLDRVSQLPLFSKVYKDIKKLIIQFLPNYLEDLTEKHCPRVKADIIEDLEKIAWEKDTIVCKQYIYLLRDIAFSGAPFTELIDKINVKLTPLVKFFKNKERFIKKMEEIIQLEGGKKKIENADILFKVKSLLENKSWEELCQSAFGDVVNLLEHVIDQHNEPRYMWRPVITFDRNCAPNWAVGKIGVYT